MYENKWEVKDRRWHVASDGYMVYAEGEEEERRRHEKVVTWQSHDWARRQSDMDRNWDEIDQICLRCGIRSKYGKHQKCRTDDKPSLREAERWEVSGDWIVKHKDCRISSCSSCESLVERRGADDSEMELMAGASQMRDALRTVRDAPYYGGSDSLVMTAEERQIVLDALEKAGG